MTEGASGALESANAALYQPSHQANTGWAGRAGYWMGRHPIWTAVLVLFFIGALANSFRHQSDSSKPPAPATTSMPETAPVNSPTIPPPKFRVFKFKVDAPLSYVVPLDTTGEQLKSLLWLFREKVRAGQFKDIGIPQPNSKQFGQLGYKSGMLLVYRGEKCANEEYISDSDLDKGKFGPCGYGEHDDAYYQWGIDGDPVKDAAGITDKDGNHIAVFDHKDNWRLPGQ